MPEGPSIVILKEAVAIYKGKKITAVTGNSKIDQQRLLNQQVIDFKSWGKHFLICFKGFTVRIHFLLFGSYLVDEYKDRPVRLGLSFGKGQINLYACAVKIIEGDINDNYDFSGDVMNDTWDANKAALKLKQHPGLMVCDALLDQDIFAGVGNIIKNEVLYRIKVHPESQVGKLPNQKQKQLIEQARIYSFDFLEWKKQFVLKQHWQAHSKKICKRCELPMLKKITGVKKRRSFFCTKCQKLFNELS